MTTEEFIAHIKKQSEYLQPMLRDLGACTGNTMDQTFAKCEVVAFLATLPMLAASVTGVPRNLLMETVIREVRVIGKKGHGVE